MFSLYHLLEETARRWPERTALRFSNQSLTYEQLLQRSGTVAGFLISQGVQRGDRVAIYMHRSFDSMAAIFGILQAGAAYVPLDSFAPTSPLASILRDCDIRCLITDESHVERLKHVAEEYDGLQFLIGPESHEGLPANSISWGKLYDGSSGTAPDIGVIEQDLSLIFYTSGSTGKPKGVAHSHRSMISNVQWALSKFDLTPDDRLCAVTSHHFDLSWFELFASMASGATLVLIPEQKVKFAPNLAEEMARERLTVWCSVPSVLMQLTQRGDLESRDLSSLRWVLFAGERFPTKHLHELMSRLPHARYCNMYGTTETHIAAYYDVPPLPEGFDEPLPIGRACSHVNLMAINEAGEPAAEGEHGELVVRGPSVMEGYWRQPERTATALVKYRFSPELEGLCYRTGDLVQLKPDGNYYILGRGDRRVKVRGYLIDLDEIEKVFLSNEQVQESAVYVLSNDDDVTQIGAAVILKPEADTQVSALRAHLSQHLPAYAIPQQIAILADLPRTGSGKISRRDLQTRKIEAAGQQNQTSTQSETLDHSIRGFILGELLNTADEGSLTADTDLISSGLVDSLGVMRLINFLEERHQIVIPDHELVEQNFNNLSSIRRLIGRLQQTE